MDAGRDASARLAVVVGSGFSAALTSGEAPVLGNRSLPALNALTDALREHMERLGQREASVPFASGILGLAYATLRRNADRPEAERYSFEEFLSLLAIGSTFSQPPYSRWLSGLPGANPSVLACLLYCLSDLFGTSLSYDGGTKANRNFWYKVNDAGRAIAMKECIWRMVDDSETTFISFNYDGMVEGFLDWWLGTSNQQERGFRYAVELSHAIPLTMPENIYSRRDSRDLSRMPKVPLILKPHGSIHFFQLREEIRSLTGGPSLAAVHPRLDIGFNPSTGQRDIPDIQFWQFADPAPLIIPPLMSKDAYFAVSYFQAMFRLVVETLQRAERVLVLGFSLPASDLYISAGFETVDWKGKKLGLVHADGPGGDTEVRWRRVAGEAAVTVLSNDGLPVDSVAAIDRFWKSVEEFLRE